MQSDNTKEVGDKKVNAQEFAKRYQALCDETGWQVVCSPVWMATNHGSFEMVLQYSVGTMPKK